MEARAVIGPKENADNCMDNSFNGRSSDYLYCSDELFDNSAVDSGELGQLLPWSSTPIKKLLI